MSDLTVMFLTLLPAIHFFELADAGPFDGRGGWGVVQRQGGGAAASCPQLLSGDSPHSPRCLLLGFFFGLFRRGRGNGLEKEQLGN